MAANPSRVHPKSAENPEGKTAIPKLTPDTLRRVLQVTLRDHKLFTDALEVADRHCFGQAEVIVSAAFLTAQDQYRKCGTFTLQSVTSGLHDIREAAPDALLSTTLGAAVTFLADAFALTPEYVAAEAPTARVMLGQWLSDRTMDSMRKALSETREHALQDPAKLLEIHTTKLAKIKAALGSGGLVITPLSEMKIETIQWLVPGRIPKGELVVIFGIGGVGKSTLVRHLEAKITKGHHAFGRTDYDPGEPGKVLIVAPEDHLQSLILPHLVVEGADTGNIATLSVATNGGGSPGRFGLEHLLMLREQIKSIPDLKLIVIETLSSFTSAAGINNNDEADVRKITDPLTDLAHETGVTVMLVAHANKNSNGNRAQHRLMGSAAYVNAARMVYGVDVHDQKPDRRALIPIKTNLPGVLKTSVVFGLEEIPGVVANETFRAHPAFAHMTPEKFAEVTKYLSRVIFDADEMLDAETIMGGRRDGGGKLDECEEWLRDFVSEGPKPSKDVEAAASVKGYTRATLNCNAPQKLDRYCRDVREVVFGVGGRSGSPSRCPCLGELPATVTPNSGLVFLAVPVVGELGGGQVAE